MQQNAPAMGEPTAGGAAAAAAPSDGEVFVNAGYTGRVALLGDSTHMGTANFLPSGIPAPGQPFFNSPSQVSGLGSGSAVDLAGSTSTDSGNAQVVSRMIVSNAGAATGTSAVNVVVQQAYGQWDRLTFGLSETAFANTSALPETLDLAGPAGRVTALSQGTGMGQGRLSYTLFTPYGPGFSTILSAESPVPEIKSAVTSNTVTGQNTAAFAKCPDFIVTCRLSDGLVTSNGYDEKWNLQFSSLFRSLGLENDNRTLDLTTFGWGTSLSGFYRFDASPRTGMRNAAFFSTTYGQGISHYIVDLGTPATNLKSVGNDAVLNSSGSLVALPVLAWYASYQYNWAPQLRSNFTYSHVGLNSNTAGADPSYYRFGEYVGANLVYHRLLNVRLPGTQAANSHNFFTGLEFLYGQKTILSGASGHDERLMWVTSLSK
jgi:hypothetical protein